MPGGGLVRRVDLGAVVAMAWLLIAVGVTAVIGPRLGLRGWAWLGLHHVLCVAGATHELWRARRRRLKREAALRVARPVGLP